MNKCEDKLVSSIIEKLQPLFSDEMKSSMSEKVLKDTVVSIIGLVEDSYVVGYKDYCCMRQEMMGECDCEQTIITQ